MRLLLLKILSHLCISMYKAHVFLKAVHEDLSVYDRHRLLKLSLFFEQVFCICLASHHGICNEMKVIISRNFKTLFII